MQNILLVQILKILSIVVPLLIAVAYFTIAESKFTETITHKQDTNLVYDRVGYYYFIFGSIAGFLGLFFVLYLRLVADFNNDIFIYDPHLFNLFFTGHGILMVFFSSMVLLICGFTYILMPLVIKSKQSYILFPKTTMFSFFLLVMSFLIFLLLGFLNIYLGNGWEIEIPLFKCFFKDLDFLVANIYCCIISYFLIATTLMISLYKIDFTRLPIFFFSIFITVLLLSVILPIITSFVTMVYCNYLFIKSDILPWANITFLFYCPILLLPSLGIISSIFLKFGKISSFNFNFIMWHFLFTGFLTYVIWIIYLFVLDNAFDVRILIIVLKTIIILIFLINIHLYYILWSSPINLDTSILFAVGYIITAFLGITTSFILITYDINILYNADYAYVQSHYLTTIVSSFAIFAGFYSCPKRFLKIYYSETLGHTHFWTFFIGINLSFFPLFFFGVKTDHSILYFLKYLSLFGFLLLIISFFVFFVVLLEAFLSKRKNNNELISNQNFFYKVGNKIDFVISLSYFLLFIAFFSISIIRSIYWAVLFYCIIITIVLIINALPDVKYYFSPVIEDSAVLYKNYKTDWTILYYTTQIFRILFMILMVCIVIFEKKNILDLMNLNSINYISDLMNLNSINFGQMFLVMTLFAIMLPIVGVLTILEVIVKLYIINFREYLFTENSNPIKSNNKIGNRKFSTVAKSTAVQSIKKISFIQGKVINAGASKLVLNCLAVGGTVFGFKFYFSTYLCILF